jgi:hypothetical protein
VIRLVMPLMIVAALAASCGAGDRSEVATNSGGVLDCTSEKVDYAHFDYGPDAVGSATPDGSLADLTADTGLPPGDPRVETEGRDVVVFVYVDDAGARLGRASAERLAGGWVVKSTERCG